MSLDAAVRLTLGDLALDVALTVDAGEIVAVVGPNGAGKTTLLRAVAGLVPVDDGRVALDGVVFDEPATRTWVPTARRPVGYVFQDHLLFAHLSVLDNVAFGLRCRGVGRAASRRVAGGWLERVGLAGLGGARPRSLSGGEAQRVALVRALAVEPRLLLLDEPLAALDATTRLQVRAELRRDLATFGGVRVLVTHDPVDAMVLADRLVVLEGGAVVQTGSPAEISRHPRTPYVARFVGLNLFRGRSVDHRVEVDGGGVLVAADTPPGGGRVFAAVRPQAVALHRTRPDGSPRNVWSGVVGSVDVAGDHVRVEVEGRPGIVAEVTPAAVAELGLDHGTPVWAAIKATDVTVYPA